MADLRLMRQWAGICDMSPDSSPIAGVTEIEGTLFMPYAGYDQTDRIPDLGFADLPFIFQTTAQARAAIDRIGVFIREANP